MTGDMDVAIIVKYKAGAVKIIIVDLVCPSLDSPAHYYDSCSQDQMNGC